MARYTLKRACGNNYVSKISSDTHISGPMREDDYVVSVLFQVAISSSSYDSVKLSSVNIRQKNSLFSQYIWYLVYFKKRPTIFKYNAMSTSSGALSLCINRVHCIQDLQLTVKAKGILGPDTYSSKTMRSEKMFPSSIGQSTHLRYILAVNGKLKSKGDTFSGSDWA